MNISKDHYTADAVIVWCFDNRFWPAFEEYLKENGLKSFDPIFLAGGAKNLASPERESDAQFVLGQIEKSIALHHTKTIVLMTHSDCGAYGGLAHFGGDAAKEMSFHRNELTHAKALIHAIPAAQNLPIRTLFVDFESIHEVV